MWKGLMLQRHGQMSGATSESFLADLVRDMHQAGLYHAKTMPFGALYDEVHEKSKPKGLNHVWKEVDSSLSRARNSPVFQAGLNRALGLRFKDLSAPKLQPLALSLPHWPKISQKHGKNAARQL